MSKREILISFYLYLNIPFSFIILRDKNYSYKKKIVYLLTAWSIPVVGYLIVTFTLVKRDFWNKILNFTLIIIVYVVFFIMLF